jgi:hypothetical protein
VRVDCFLLATASVDDSPHGIDSVGRLLLTQIAVIYSLTQIAAIDSGIYEDSSRLEVSGSAMAHKDTISQDTTLTAA